MGSEAGTIEIRGKCIMAKRILYVATVDWFFISHRLPLAVAAQSAGYDVTVAASDTGVAHKIKEAGLKFAPLPFSRSSLNPILETKTLLAIWKIIRRVKPDVLHNVSLKPVLYGGIAGRMARVPRIISAITGFGHLFSNASGGAMRKTVQVVLRWLWNSSHSIIIVQNEDHATFIREQGLEQSSQIVVIQGAGVDMERFKPRDEAQESNIVVLPARMLVSKGVLDFAEAAKVLKARGSNHRFVLVGPGGDDNPEAISEDALRGLETSHGVEWWGRRDDMERVFAEAKLVVLPSTYGEGMPKALIEALASGRPIITTDIPGCRQLVDGMKNGWLCAPGDVDGLTRVLEEALSDTGRLNIMGENARQFATKYLSIQTVIRETLSVYE